MTQARTITRTDAVVAVMARMLIKWRKPLGLFFMLLTLGLGYSALNTRLDPGFNKLIPLKHEYMAAFLEHAGTFSGANRVLVSVEWKGEGDIYNAEFLPVLRKVNDEVFFTPGVNRASVRSIFTPNVRYIEVTEQGFNGDVVIPARFETTEAGLNQVRANVAKAGVVGRLVANDLKSALVQADLLEISPETGERLDYAEVARKLETIRAQFASENIDIQIVGFAKVMGDVMEGLFTVVMFFLVAFVITSVLLWLYSRSLKLTVLAIAVALLPVIWLLGILPLIGYGIDPMSVLVPFLIFSIGVSHAVQMTNAWKQDVLAGETAMEAAEGAFRKLAIPGIMALLANALGFLVIMVIDIPIVHELGLTACLGVALMIMTNKMFMPIILSHLHLERVALDQPVDNKSKHPTWWKVSALSEPRPALVTFAVMLVLLGTATYYSRQLLTGDIGSGVPELHADSRYNRDNDRIISNYSIGMDVLSVYVETENLKEACLNWEVMNAVERFDFHMRGVDGVQSVSSVASLAKLYASGNNEANPRWAALQRTEAALRTGGRAANPENGLNSHGCKTIHIAIYLTDHQGPTLKHVVDEVQKFIATNKHRQRHLPPRRRQRRRRHRHQRSGGEGRSADAGVDLRVHLAAVLAHLPLLARSAVRDRAADAGDDHVQCADGAARHRPQGGDAAGDRPRRRGRGRLRHLHLRAPAARDGGARLRPARGLLRGHAPARHRGGVHRGDDVDRGRHLGVLGAEVPGRHGHPARLHVPGERARRDLPAAGAGVLAGHRTREAR
ncbi:hypothetical protein MASR2M50_24190 [Thauera sp.]